MILVCLVFLRLHKNNIRPVIHDFSQVKIIENTTLKKNIKLWIKIDTGMNRLGFHSSDFEEVFKNCKNVSDQVGIMTHLACADEDEDNFSNKQISLLEDFVNGKNVELSIFNSAGTIRYSKKFNNNQHWIRPGLVLYGKSIYLTKVQVNLTPYQMKQKKIISLFKKCLMIKYMKFQMLKVTKVY